MSDFIYPGINLPRPLSSDDEKRLLKDMKDNQEIKNILIERNLRLVLYIAKNFNVDGISIEDLMSIGTLGLIRAVNTFSIEKNVKFATFASKCIKNEILLFLRKNKKYLEIVDSLEKTIYSDNEGNECCLYDLVQDNSANSKFEKIYEQNDFCSTLFTIILNTFSQRNLLILLYTISGATQQEIANIFSISQSYVSRIQKSNISKVEKIALEKQKFTLQYKKFIFYLIDDQYFAIGFFKSDFKNFLKISSEFLKSKNFTEDSLNDIIQDNEQDYFLLKMFLEPESFSYIAELIMYMNKKTN